MLARKQSVKGGTEPLPADYGPDESFNESADIDWVNKVSQKTDREPRMPDRSGGIRITISLMAGLNNNSAKDRRTDGRIEGPTNDGLPA